MLDFVIMDLRYHIPVIIKGDGITILAELCDTSKKVKFLSDETFKVIIVCISRSNNLTLGEPEISPGKGASVFMSFLSLDFVII